MAAFNTHIERQVYHTADVEELTGWHRLTLRRRWKRKLFPEPKLIGGRLCWLASEIRNWISENVGVKHG
jgi:predicted DNA-binding transcriptional regulator AlpA